MPRRWSASYRRAWQERGRYANEWFIPQAAVDHWRELHR